MRPFGVLGAQPQNWNIPPLPYLISLPNRTLSSSSDQNMLICLKTVPVCWWVSPCRPLHKIMKYLIYQGSFPFPPKILSSMVGPASGFILPLLNFVAAAT